jgi:ribonuclease P protein component
MGTRSSQPPSQKGAQTSHGTAAEQVRRRLSLSTRDLRFPRRQRLTRASDLRAVDRDGKRLRAAKLEIRALVTNRGISRIGFVVPRFGRTAVNRNRLKRRLRELARLHVLGALREVAPAAAADVVIRARPESYDASLTVLRSEVECLLPRLTSLLAETVGRAGPSGTGAPENP